MIALIYPEDLDYLYKKNDDFVEMLREVHENANKMSSYLCKTASDQHAIISEIVDDLEDLGETVGVFPEGDDYFKGLPSIKSFIYDVKFNVGKLVQKNSDLELKLTECKNEVADLKKKDERMKFLEEMYKEKVKNDALFVKTDSTQYREIIDLRGVVDEQQKLIEEFRQMRKDDERLKHLNDQRDLSRKELEDLEDTLSRDIKMLHMRKLFVQNIQAEKVKPVDVDVEDQRRVIEESLGVLMDNIKALQTQVDHIKKIVQQQKSTGR